MNYLSRVSGQFYRMLKATYMARDRKNTRLGDETAVAHRHHMYLEVS